MIWTSNASQGRELKLILQVSNSTTNLRGRQLKISTPIQLPKAIISIWTNLMPKRKSPLILKYSQISRKTQRAIRKLSILPPTNSKQSHNHLLTYHWAQQSLSQHLLKVNRKRRANRYRIGNNFSSMLRNKNKKIQNKQTNQTNKWGIVNINSWRLTASSWRQNKKTCWPESV